MKIETNKNGEIILKEVYSSIGLESDNKELLDICMRDSGFEFKYNGQLYEAKQGKVRKLKGQLDTASDSSELAKAKEEHDQYKNLWEQIQESLDEMNENHTLKSDSALIDDITEFGRGVMEIHSADLERLIREKHLLEEKVNSLIELINTKEAIEEYSENINECRKELLLSAICQYTKRNTQKEIQEVEKWIETDFRK
ncbi:hypothetical protein [Flammeovirga agarivorans]|uniref:Uncharacterized protein n=1 Tax=Flammeovirga agarivorans TaxID=2726742 RepID=A0A7X8SRB4_9BACT|nr:hypothetical protein [Flammeovirga agarivorans]NLR94948.1 hypothetical protein [Flammeovirga agarivorans]